MDGNIEADGRFERPAPSVNALRLTLSALVAMLAYPVALAASDQLPNIIGAVPAVYALAAGAAGVAAYLLRSRGAAFHNPRLCWVASACWVSCLAIALQLLAFPSISESGGPAGTTPTGATALYLLRHLVLAAFALAALVLPDAAHRARVVGTVASVVAVVYSAVGVSPLPQLVDAAGRYTGELRAVLSVLIPFSLVATVAWAARIGRRPTSAEAWVTVCLACATWDVALYAFAEERFGVVWWASLSMRLAQFLALAVGLIGGSVALYRALDRYSAGLTERLAEELRQARAAADPPQPGRRQRELTVARVERFLEGEGLRIVFQPIVELGSGRMIGMEALSRFGDDPAHVTESAHAADAARPAHPTEPPRSPGEWFEDAASVDLATDLELAAVRVALGRLPELPDGVFLSLNVSPETMRSGRLSELLTGTPPSTVVVEVTEHAPVDNYEALNAAVSQLRSRGVRLAVDDAGAGFASLRHILRLHPDIIKLDVSLTRNVDQDPVRQALAASLVACAGEMSATIVAEGIETEAELDALRALGADCGQGFHLGRPAPLPAAEAGVAARGTSDGHE